MERLGWVAGILRNCAQPTTGANDALLTPRQPFTEEL
jgi:hypothetical protein